MAKDVQHNDNYIKVKQRIVDLKKNGSWDNASVNTELVKEGTKKDATGKEKMYVIVKATLTMKINDAHLTYTGMAMETEGIGEVNYLSFLENAETSAVGRALSFSGIEDVKEENHEDVNVASKEEIKEAKDKNKDLSIEKKKQHAVNLIQEAINKKVTPVVAKELKPVKEYNESNIPIFKGIPANSKIRPSEHRKEIINFLQREKLLQENNLVDALIRSGLSVKYKKVDELFKSANQGELIMFIQNIKQ